MGIALEAGTRGEARIGVSVPPGDLYDMVADVTRMGEWSPETVRCVWLDGATGAAEGARFKGTNRRGVFRWSTKPKVVAAVPGKQFAFETRDTRWTYDFQPAPDGGTELVESFELTRDEPLVIALAGRYLMRIPDRKADLERGMQETLGRIKAAAEG